MASIGELIASGKLGSLTLLLESDDQMSTDPYHNAAANAARAEIGGKVCSCDDCFDYRKDI